MLHRSITILYFFISTQIGYLMYWLGVARIETKSTTNIYLLLKTQCLILKYMDLASSQFLRKAGMSHWINWNNICLSWTVGIYQYINSLASYKIHSISLWWKWLILMHYLTLSSSFIFIDHLPATMKVQALRSGKPAAHAVGEEIF